MNKQKGYRIAQYEQALPSEATIEEVRYYAKTGLRVNYVIGTVQIRIFHPDGILDKRIRVTWDNEGLCRKLENNIRMPDYDLKLEGGTS